MVGNINTVRASDAAKPENRDSVVKSFVRVEAISRRVLEQGFEWQWTSTAEYLRALGTRLGINVGALVGHIAVRHYVLGEDAVERVDVLLAPEEAAPHREMLGEVANFEQRLAHRASSTSRQAAERPGPR